MKGGSFHMALILFPVIQLLRFLSFLLRNDGFKKTLISPLSRCLKVILIGRESICQKQIFDALKFMQQQEIKTNLISGQSAQDLEKRSKEQTNLYFEHLSMSILEWISIFGRQKHALLDDVEVIGEDLIDEALKQKRGLLLLTLHLGNWEILLRKAGDFHHPVHVISKEMHQGLSQILLQKLRMGGPSILYGKMQAFKIAKALKQNEIVVDVLDQHCPKKTAIPCLFFGKKAYSQSDFLRWQSLLGSEVLLIYTYRKAHRHVIEIRKIDLIPTHSIEERVQQVMYAYENLIYEHFEQWLWIHRRWKENAKTKI